MASGSEQTIVAIHQPNYLPWLGYFHKISQCDCFVFHDNVELSKSSPTRRVPIRAHRNSTSKNWLTVPLKYNSDFSLIKDLFIDHNTSWPQKHLNKIKTVYAKYPYFDENIDFITSLFSEMGQYKGLAGLNMFLILKLMNHLNINTPTIRSSKLPVFGRKSSYNIALVKKLGGSIYLSGKGAKKYQSKTEFEQAGIILKYNEPLFNLIPGYEIGNSIIESIFAIGTPNLRQYFKKSDSI